MGLVGVGYGMRGKVEGCGGRGKWILEAVAKHSLPPSNALQMYSIMLTLVTHGPMMMIKPKTSTKTAGGIQNWRVENSEIIGVFVALL